MNLSGRLGTGKPPEWLPFNWRGLRFPNRLGIAGGVDKDAIGLKGWWRAGAGFVEVGTVTPRPQTGNTGTLVGRDTRQRALWNRLGFPSQGVDRVVDRLMQIKRPYPTPLFVNIGKNAMTRLEEAHHDYTALVMKLTPWVDGFVINISSPNTMGLRKLLEPENLKQFLQPVRQKVVETGKPWLLKISPDMGEGELIKTLEISSEAGVDGWILTNTTMQLRKNLRFPVEGGVSGAPLGELSKRHLYTAVSFLGKEKKDRLLISVGGIMDERDVQERLALGADLVQVYSTLIFEGPGFFRKVARWQRENL